MPLGPILLTRLRVLTNPIMEGLRVSLTGGNRNDITQLMPLSDSTAVPHCRNGCRADDRFIGVAGAT